MQIVKARRQGNSITVTLDKSLNIAVGQEFYIYHSDNGSITLIPKVRDIFKNVKPGEYADMDTDSLAKNYEPQGNENE